MVVINYQFRLSLFKLLYLRNYRVSSKTVTTTWKLVFFLTNVSFTTFSQTHVFLVKYAPKVVEIYVVIAWYVKKNKNRMFRYVVGVGDSVDDIQYNYPKWSRINVVCQLSRFLFSLTIKTNDFEEISCTMVHKFAQKETNFIHNDP